jgi:lipopolysaccharide/colanic/teichoic acid biosynthesis glycosyltransferase
LFLKIRYDVSVISKNHKCVNKLFWANKRIFDVLVSLILLPLLLVVGIVLLLLNRFFNPGKLFFIQERMGRECKIFFTIKFRSMAHIKEIIRKYDEPIEINRITPLGKILRKMRIDELPQIVNVLKGEMSLIGPRPDYYIHALEYLNNIEGYRERYSIRPGITGLSQVRLGYAEGLEATLKKTYIDNYYIKNVGYIIDIKIAFNTLLIIICGLGK